MAMTKAEKQTLEDVKTQAALRWTSDITPDVTPPGPLNQGIHLTKGWMFTGDCLNYPRVERACSSGVHHAVGQDAQTDSQGSRALFSTRILALRALRFVAEQRAAKALRYIDRLIEQARADEEQS